MNKKRQQELLLFILALAVVAFVGIDSVRFFTRFDMTENGAYTISSVSKNLFREIPEQVQVTYYISEKLEKMHPMPKQIEDLLNEYSAFSHGKIRVSIVDPAKTASEAAVERLGVLPQQIQTVEQNEQSVAMVYTGIVIQYLDRTETLPVVFATDTLEYELSSRIRKIVRNQQKVVGVVVGDAGKNFSQDFQTLQQSLQRSFTVRELQPGQDVPADVSVLFVLGGTGLDDFDLYPIDQYIMRGGHTLFAVPGVDVDAQQTLTATAVTNDSPLTAIATYGVQIGKQLVLDKSSLTVPFQTASPLGGMMINLVQYPHWISIRSENVSTKNPITSRFAGLSLFWPSPLEARKVDGVKAEPIVNSTGQAWLQTKNFVTTPNAGPAAFYAEQGSTTRKYVLAYALSGEFQSYFAGKPIPVRKGTKTDWKDTLAKGRDTRMIVVGNSAFATELQQYSRNTGNIDFLLNSADWLSSDDDLLSIKTRVTHEITLNRIQDPAQKAAAAFWAEAVNVVFIPLLVIFFAVWRTAKRRKLQRTVPEATNDVQK
jgi:gliding-associated putative ABC transporter substrate-binding component GldG